MQWGVKKGPPPPADAKVVIQGTNISEERLTCEVGFSEQSMVSIKEGVGRGNFLLGL